MICENHGAQHYIGGFGIEKKYIIQNDAYKKELALSNGIDFYIELDCRVSDGKYIYDSILNSNLCDLLNVIPSKNIISLCESYASKSLFIEACNIKGEKPNICATEVAQLLGLDHTTILRYWKKGEKLGWCLVSKHSSKIINVYLNTHLVKTFKSTKDVISYFSEVLNITLCPEMVKRNCNGITDNYKGYVFKYA